MVITILKSILSSIILIIPYHSLVALFLVTANAMFALTSGIGPDREQAEIKAEQLMGSYLFSSGAQVIVS